MKQKTVILLAMMAVVVLLSACGSEAKEDVSIMTDNNWVAGDESYLVCETDGSFRYYQTKEDLTDNYYEGTYLFFIGDEAVAYVTEELSEYGVTKEELKDVFERNKKYDTDNFICLVLNNETCIVGGENIMREALTSPYYGFLLSEDGKIYLDIANMNTGNYHSYTSSD